MFGPDFTAGCPSCSSVANGFNGIIADLAKHDVMFWAISRAPLAKLQAYKHRMGWTFPWASSFGSDFNFDFHASFTSEQLREGAEYNFRRADPVMNIGGAGTRSSGPDRVAAMTGTDVGTYTREREGMSAFVLDEGIVHHTHSPYARGVDAYLGLAAYHEDGRAQSLVISRPAPQVVNGGSASGDALRERRVRPMTFERASQPAFFGTSALLFVATAALTVIWCGSMSAMGAMPMPGGWAMSMAWVPMSGQTWVNVSASFLGMWVVMMIAMMLPSFAPVLWRFHRAMNTRKKHSHHLTALVAMGYFFVWSICGVPVFLQGVALAEIEMRQPALARIVPIAIGVVVLFAGASTKFSWQLERHGV